MHGGIGERKACGVGRVSQDSSVSVDAISSELRTVLANARTLTGLRSLELPELDGLLLQVRASRDDLACQLEQAISLLDDPLYRSAAKDLFPLPYRDDAAWPKLAARGRDAGGRFDISYDGLRRASDGRQSQLDKVLVQVAEKLIALVAERRAYVQPGSGADPLATTPAPSDAGRGRAFSAVPSKRRRVVFVLALGVVIAVLATVVAWPDSSEFGDEPSIDGASISSPNGCQPAVGLLDQQLAMEPEAAQWRARLGSVYQSSARSGLIGCPAGPAYRWQSVVVQELVRDGRGDGALIVSPNDVDLYLNNAAWGSYHQIGGKTGTASQTTGGLPIRMVVFADGHIEIELSTGTIMVAESIEAPYFWIPAVFVPWWHSQYPQVGLPSGNPLPTLRQDFQKGVVAVNLSQPGVPVFTAVDQPGRELPTTDLIVDRLLTQSDGTAWLVSTDGKRLWIPDGATWDCLGGDAKRVARDLPGYAIASLPFGGQAGCPR